MFGIESIHYFPAVLIIFIVLYLQVVEIDREDCGLYILVHKDSKSPIIHKESACEFGLDLKLLKLILDDIDICVLDNALLINLRPIRDLDHLDDRVF